MSTIRRDLDGPFHQKRELMDAFHGDVTVVIRSGPPNPVAGRR